MSRRGLTGYFCTWSPGRRSAAARPAGNPRLWSPGRPYLQRLTGAPTTPARDSSHARKSLPTGGLSPRAATSLGTFIAEDWACRSGAGVGCETDGRPGRLPREEERRGTPGGVRNPAGAAARWCRRPPSPPDGGAFRDHVTTEQPASGMLNGHPSDTRRRSPDAGRAVARGPLSAAGSALPFHPPAEAGRAPRAVARTRDVRAAGPTPRSRKVLQWPTRCSSMPPTRRRRAS
jgi:hypothetical protein